MEELADTAKASQQEAVLQDYRTGVSGSVHVLVSVARCFDVIRHGLNPCVCFS